MAAAPRTSVCPSCHVNGTVTNHCATRDLGCGWLRCGQHACKAVWRESDRHVMAPGATDVKEHG